ncbi:MAG TPA: tRNA (adenosine(37)-N6)-dimethylallyltransferase MiaA [Bryobacteraceae bacterium]|nr:tRNA (adenosine(37)-N6)-dimethylallyltransferase MiaA [Bryobacteraceae bacterium]
MATADPPLVVVAGPTGSGKSDLALRIAEDFCGEVVNCDSLQIYRYFDIGTAKLPEFERRGIPHHLIDIVDPGEHFSAGEYARRARRVISEIAARKRLPVVAGGTGFYVRALLDGLFPGPARDDTVRARLEAREARRPGGLHRLLRRFDPEAARRIHARDTHKLVRAVEVCLLLRRPLTDAFAAGRDPLTGFHVLKIALDPPRQALYERLDRRCERMFETGLVDEVNRILDLGFSPEVKPLESHGYKQALQHIRGELSLPEAVLQAQRNTRRYAKRQWTWFRREPGIQRFGGFGDDPDVQAAVLEQIRKQM